MDADRGIIRISVRNLVEFVMRSGDIDNRRTSAAEKDAMQAGSRMHRKIQKRQGADYHAEVPMKHTVEQEDYRILVEGRADGVIEAVSGVTIDEIKCVYLDIHQLEEPLTLHLAQALCYAYMYCADHENINSITIQITYCNLETEEIRRLKQDKTREELEEWFQGLIHEYVKWAKYLYHHTLRRNESLRELQFPYEYRTEGACRVCVSGTGPQAQSVYSGADRNRKDPFRGLPILKIHGQWDRREAVLPDGKNHYPKCGGKLFCAASGAGHVVYHRDCHSERKTLPHGKDRM